MIGHSGTVSSHNQFASKKAYYWYKQIRKVVTNSEKFMDPSFDDRCTQTWSSRDLSLGLKTRFYKSWSRSWSWNLRVLVLVLVLESQSLGLGFGLGSLESRSRSWSWDLGQ